MITKKEIIEILELEPLMGEGGLWKKSCFSDLTLPGGAMPGYPIDRPLYGAIYYLLTPETFSCMHRLTTDEIWYHHTGPAVRLLLIYEDGTSEVKLLGQDLKRGERPQIRVRRGTWQGAAIDPFSRRQFDDPDDEIYTLLSTSMAPEYLACDYEAGTYEDLKQYVYEEDLELLEFLTGSVKY
ncbi:MAG: cupin domain-containing protein [Firmicutes bacterium]|nr:cupin domain-containing protein [Bacillota bacterium]